IMGSYTYSPETNAKIDKLCRDSAVAIMLSFPNESIDEIDVLLKATTQFIRECFTALGAREFLIAYDFKSSTGGVKIDVATVASETRSGNNVFVVNKAMELVKVERMEYVSVVSVASYSLSNTTVIILIHNGVDISIYSKGVPIEQRNLNHPSALPVLNKKFNRPAEDYKLSVIEFYREKVRTNLTDHWADVKKRILRGGQTEEIFHAALVQWLVDNLTAKRINFEVKKLSTDKTDIEIIKHGGDTFLLELKWLGQNEKSTYSLNKLTDAFDQVKNYLDTDPDVLEATLIVYDGRDLAEYEKLVFIEQESGNWKEIKECETKTMPYRGTAFIFHLINETASKRKSA
ncbi:MAG: hypothetical protein ACTHNW_19565, partial [Mucilaginibacter sp.]